MIYQQEGGIKLTKITLAAARVNAGFSQMDAAKKLGVSRRTISNWENCKTYPDANQLTILCDLYKWPTDGIFLIEDIALSNICAALCVGNDFTGGKP